MKNHEEYCRSHGYAKLVDRLTNIELTRFASTKVGLKVIGRVGNRTEIIFQMTIAEYERTFGGMPEYAALHFNADVLEPIQNEDGQCDIVEVTIAAVLAHADSFLSS